MFIDETVIYVKAGDGGNGCHSYERLKYKPKGKPDGGNGGRGGSVYLVGSPQVHTLSDIAYKRKYTADRGAHGKGKNQAGRGAEDIIIPVPLGTIVYDDISGDILLDCLNPQEPQLIAKGGRGGRGNAALVTKYNPNPERSEYGKPGEEKQLRLVLKVLADVGLVGRPNAGKSTFLSRVSHARPKIADYPFTTTKPELGIVQLPGEYDSFVIADIPGLIENCHEGKGLGIRFLRHIERTKILAILVDASSEDPQADADLLIKELTFYSKRLSEKPKCFILTKTDTIPADQKLKVPDGWMSMSSVSGENVDTVLWELKKLVDQNRINEDSADFI